MVSGRGWWNEPVAVIPGRNGVTLNVNNTAQARRVLDEEWPMEGGEKLRAARLAVRWAKVSAMETRALFKEAAEEAGILTEPTQRPTRSPEAKPTQWRGKQKLKRDM